MRKPSPRVRKNRVDIYTNVSGPDAGGGVQFTFSTTPTASQVPCSLQFRGVEEVVLDWKQDRISQVNTYWVMFASQQALSPRDKLIWVDSLGVQRTLFVNVSNTDEAGRHSAFIVKAIELL